MKVRIEITKGPDLGGQFLLNPNEKTVIGRGGDASIQMKDGLISREHCELKCDGKRLLIQDLGSTNHTFIQKNLVEPIPPHVIYEVANGGSFFVGPESRFTVTYVTEAQDQIRPPESNHPKKSSYGNFTVSVERPDTNHDVEESSIFNLSGPVPSNPGLGDGGRGAPPPVTRPVPPASKPIPPTTGSDSPVPGEYAGSIAPPNSQGQDEVIRPQVGDDAFADDSYLKSTPKIERPATARKTTTVSEPATTSNPNAQPPKHAADDATFFRSAGHSESIAVPGTYYAQPDTNPTGLASVGENPPNPFDSSIMVPNDLVAPPKTPAPASSSEVLPAPDVESKSRENGLYFHTGNELRQLSEVIAELCQNLAPVYCIDLSRCEPESGDASAFDLEVDRSDAKDGQIVGQPIFDFFPDGIKYQGPVLMTADEFGFSLEEAWHHDAVVVFFGQDAGAMLSHLTALVHINIQNGKTFKGMFGYCWPGILHTTFEGQGKQQVARIFGESISCVLLEDPQQRYAWNLVAMKDMTGELNSLPQMTGR